MINFLTQLIPTAITLGVLIFIHELGHLAGLNHSCEAKDKDGFPNCTAANIKQEYLFAVMFPIVVFSNNIDGEKRRQLQSNDQGRMNCVYDKTSD